MPGARVELKVVLLLVLLACRLALPKIMTYSVGVPLRSYAFSIGEVSGRLVAPERWKLAGSREANCQGLLVA